MPFLVAVIVMAAAGSLLDQFLTYLERKQCSQSSERGSQSSVSHGE